MSDSPCHLARITNLRAGLRADGHGKRVSAAEALRLESLAIAGLATPYAVQRIARDLLSSNRRTPTRAGRGGPYTGPRVRGAT
ncbi:MAG: hypothetical protein JNN03_19390 [Rubrivivax sp.]|nr:hypothetical protein [Rubrivivax sp.]